MTALTAPPTWRFTLELHADGRPAHAVPLERADFARAAEAVFFAALRDGQAADYAPALDLARVEPLPGAAPLAPGFQVTLPLPGGDRRGRFALDYFKTSARRHGAALAVAGALAPGAAVTYRLAARPDAPPPPARPGLAFQLDEEPATIPIREGRLRSLGALQAHGSPRPDDLPVVAPLHVLEDAIDEARRAPDREVGGVLLGHLRRDLDDGGLYLEITGSVPCEGTHATEASVTFTHETWARAREVLALRGEGELIVGWVHSHPFRLCAECPTPAPAECRARVLFYSADDEFLMEAAFPRPFMVGLLTAVEPRLGPLPVQLFGWRDGVIAPRGLEFIP